MTLTPIDQARIVVQALFGLDRPPPADDSRVVRRAAEPHVLTTQYDAAMEAMLSIPPVPTPQQPTSPPLLPAPAYSTSRPGGVGAHMMLPLSVDGAAMIDMLVRMARDRAADGTATARVLDQVMADLVIERRVAAAIQ